MRALLIRHIQVFFYSLGQLWRTPWGSLMSVAVIAVSLTLPTALYLVLELTDEISGSWQTGAEITLFLTAEVDDKAAVELADRLRQRPGIRSVSYVSAAAALEEFRQKSGFGVALDLLDQNPLPSLLRLQPDPDQAAPAQINQLIEQFQALAEVDTAEFDHAWVQRLHAMVAIGQRLALIASLLLGVGVVLIIGNTIRLAIFNRRDEIEISKLIGATDAFIRRPFLYSGLQQGALGGLLALLLVYASLSLLAPVADRLAGFYQSGFTLQIMGWVELLLLPIIGGALGLFGAWLAVGRHLRDIEPG